MTLPKKGPSQLWFFNRPYKAPRRDLNIFKNSDPLSGWFTILHKYPLGLVGFKIKQKYFLGFIPSLNISLFIHDLQNNLKLKTYRYFVSFQNFLLYINKNKNKVLALNQFLKKITILKLLKHPKIWKNLRKAFSTPSKTNVKMAIISFPKILD